jgi:uncharacterized protein (DUF4415 family)
MKIAELPLPDPDEEEARIQAGIARDPDNPEWTKEDFDKARPFAEVLPELAESWRRTQVRQKPPTKKLVSLRLDQDVIEHFKAQGRGWQTRINEALRSLVARDRQSPR